MNIQQEWNDLVKELSKIFEEASPDDKRILLILEGRPAPAIALALEQLPANSAIHVFRLLDDLRSHEVLGMLAPELTKLMLKKTAAGALPGMIAEMAPRDAATVLSEAPRKYVKRFLAKGDVNPATKEDLACRLYYPKGSAGRIMTRQFIIVSAGAQIGEVIALIRKTDPSIDIPDDIFVVEKNDRVPSGEFKKKLAGVVSIRELLMHDAGLMIEDIMAKDVVFIPATATDDDAAALVSKYKFMALPVVDSDGYLTGVIPIDDLMQVIVSRTRRLYSHAVGTDAETMEKLSPVQAAKLRVPWLLGTMIIELMAGLVISHFDGVLQKVILLASFMPVISAISGNVGLQAAAITVRALDSAHINRKSLGVSLGKEGATSLIMAIVCGLVLGTIGAIWSKHLPFGIVIGVALICSMLTAGLMGTVIPAVSKRLGFDPATTAGPFETAFQDVVGFSVFLWMATVLQHWIV